MLTKPRTQSSMKAYIVWRFILGLGMESAEYEFVDANNQEEAEAFVSDPYSGWGILGSREWTKEDEESEEPIKFDLW